MRAAATVAATGAQQPIERRPGRRPLILDATIRQSILDRIRVGAFEWVACEAAGVSQRTFQYWTAKGEQGIEPYVQFFQDVQQVRAQARLSAEMRVHADDPKFWLRVGPGRERPSRPGWTEESRTEITTPSGEPLEVEHRLVLNEKQYREIAHLADVAGLLPEPRDEGAADAASAE